MIEKGVPIPNDYQGQSLKQTWKYPWRACEEVGDSFLVTGTHIVTIEAAIKKFSQRNRQYKFIARLVNSKPYSVRVWRVA